jgi:threonine dehydrogenase-like Zn-dependent dehydrogenase
LLEEFSDWADVVCECSGAPAAVAQSIYVGAAGSRVVWVGMGADEVAIPLGSAQPKEQSFYTIFRYANCYPMALSLIEQGSVEPRPLISRRFEFPQVQAALEFAGSHPEDAIKTMVVFPEDD